MSSKPTRAIRRSHSARTRTAVTVTRLLPEKSAVTGSGPVSIASTAALTRAGPVGPSETQASSTVIPASVMAA